MRKSVLLFFVLSAWVGAVAYDYLKDKIPTDNQRYETFKYVLELLEQRSGKILVETGTARYGDRHFDSDGGSTIIFAQWSRDHSADFFSIDLNDMHLDTAKKAVIRYVPDYQDHIHYVYSDSIVFLREFNQPIDLLYLDSYDYELDNPAQSQEHHLKEIQASYPFLTKKSIVMIDDCALAGGGKGKLVIEFLVKHGWKIVKAQYQTILCQDIE
jgi:hypothetical protein